MIERLPIAFLAGLLSVVAPCVLPLVPAYLSAVSAVESRRFSEPRVARRVALASVPFILGFTVVFVLLGAAAAAIVSVVDQRTQQAIAGFVLVVVGLTFLRLLPWPERTIAPRLLTGARRQGSNVLLGAAFAVCAAPCVGPLLAGALALASDADTVLRGSAILAAYSLGLGVAFLLAAVAFARAMTAFRWLRDHYRTITAVGGAALVAFGLLTFFDRVWWLSALAGRVLPDSGFEG